MKKTNHTPHSSTSLLVVVATALPLLLPGVAAARNLDSARVKDIVSRVVHNGTGLATREIECPRRIPMLEGQRSTCTAKLSDGTTIAVDFVQTNDQGDIIFGIRDELAFETLGAPSRLFIERWLAGEYDAIYQDAHALLRDDLDASALENMLHCTAADYGGLDGAGEATRGLIRRPIASGEIHVPLQFDGGLEIESVLTFNQDGADWKLAGLNLPPAPQDAIQADDAALLTSVQDLLENADRGRWRAVYDALSHELRRDHPIEEVQQSLDDPWNQGSPGKSRVLASARNAHGLPVLSVMTQRANGPARSLFTFRTCGDSWMIRTVELLSPDRLPATIEPTEAEAFLADQARSQGVDLSADCPGEEFPILSGLTYSCTARHPSGAIAPIQFTFTNDAGAVQWRLLPTADWPQG